MKNVGGWDRAFRIVGGLGVVSLLFWLDGSWRFAGLLGLPLLWTGITRFCMMNRLLERNTCRTR